MHDDPCNVMLDNDGGVVDKESITRGRQTCLDDVPRTVVLDGDGGVPEGKRNTPCCCHIRHARCTAVLYGDGRGVDVEGINQCGCHVRLCEAQVAPMCNHDSAGDVERIAVDTRSDGQSAAGYGHGRVVGEGEVEQHENLVEARLGLCTLRLRRSGRKCRTTIITRATTNQ